MQLTRRFKKLFISYYVIDIYSKYKKFVPLKGKKCITITNTFQKVLDKFCRKFNEIWADKSSDFYSRKMNSLVAERFNKTLKNKTFRYMTAVLKDKCS